MTAPAGDLRAAPGVSFTVTQLQRLRELGMAAAAERRYPSAAERDAGFKQLEHELTGAGRRRLEEVRRGRRRPVLAELESALATALADAGFVQVLTPHIIAGEALEKMGIPRSGQLAEHVYWIDGGRCLRPMLAPNLYTLLRRFGRIWSRPFGIFEIGACFRRDSQGGRHLDEFTMLNLVELGTPLDERRARLEALAALVLSAARLRSYEFATVESSVYGDTLDIMASGIEVCSAAMGPHALDDAWGITEPWVGLGFGLERLLMARDGHANIERVGPSLSYFDGVRLNL